MLLLYNIGIHLYYVAVYIASFFNQKAARWINGRKHQQIKNQQNTIWFHFASLGEFEQGRPVLEKLKLLRPQEKIVITFFSPSGYEIRKNTPLADAVYYLPLDTTANARTFIETINPQMAVFTKYEYWYHFFNQLHQRHIPLYLISGIFRTGQVFFKWHGVLHRKMLGMVTHFFVQDQASAELLQNINIKHLTVAGDTRFDRVWENAASPKQLPAVNRFKSNRQVFIAGSTWPQDEELLNKLITRYPEWKFIFAPHEIGEEKIKGLLSLLPADRTIRFSAGPTDQQLTDAQILIIDNIGMLSSIYQYGEVAYIGGGFGAGIHNTLEAAAFGLPVIFGPNYLRFKEAVDIIGLKAGISITDQQTLLEAADLLLNDAEYRSFASQKIRHYVQTHTGATDKIIGMITA